MMEQSIKSDHVYVTILPKEQFLDLKNKGVS